MRIADLAAKVDVGLAELLRKLQIGAVGVELGAQEVHLTHHRIGSAWDFLENLRVIHRNIRSTVRRLRRRTGCGTYERSETRRTPHEYAQAKGDTKPM
jgi:hypothetical protein